MKRTSSAIINTNLKSKAPKVPRPMNCFMTYRLEKQREIVERCPGANHRDISKIIAKWWKELPAEEKEPYRLKAEKAKMEHKELYPGYKFSPKKKMFKPRAYKKRPENQFTARDYQDEQELFKLYHEGKDVLPIVNNGKAMPLILDAKEPKTTTSSNKTHRTYSKKSTLGHENRTCNSSPLFEQQKRSSSYDTRLLYPPVSNSSVVYSTGSVPSQSVYSPVASSYSTSFSPSTSPYTTGYYSSSEEPNQQDISYNLYPSHYGYPAHHQPAVTYDYYSQPVHYYNSTTVSHDFHVYPPTVYNGQSCHSAESASPALLTSAYYYQHQHQQQ